MSTSSKRAIATLLPTLLLLGACASVSKPQPRPPVPPPARPAIPALLKIDRSQEVQAWLTAASTWLTEVSASLPPSPTN